VAAGKKREIKDVSEMLGEFFREAAVLVLVFFPLDVALKDGGNVPFPFLCVVGALSLTLLIAGIYFEKRRGE
jgi:hypothetical protein